jgi:hypothetical protein
MRRRLINCARPEAREPVRHPSDKQPQRTASVPLNQSSHSPDKVPSDKCSFSVPRQAKMLPRQKCRRRRCCYPTAVHESQARLAARPHRTKFSPCSRSNLLRFCAMTSASSSSSFCPQRMRAHTLSPPPPPTHSRKSSAAHRDVPPATKRRLCLGRS